MKTLLIMGGILGFAIGIGFSWAQESAWPASLWHGCACAYIAGVLMKCWGRAWRRNLEHVLHERQNAPSDPISVSSLKAK